MGTYILMVPGNQIAKINLTNLALPTLTMPGATFPFSVFGIDPSIFVYMISCGGISTTFLASSFYHIYYMRDHRYYKLGQRQVETQTRVAHHKIYEWQSSFFEPFFSGSRNSVQHSRAAFGPVRQADEEDWLEDPEGLNYINKSSWHLFSKAIPLYMIVVVFHIIKTVQLFGTVAIIFC